MDSSIADVIRAYLHRGDVANPCTAVGHLVFSTDQTNTKMRSLISVVAIFALAAAAAQADSIDVNVIVDNVLNRLSNNEHLTTLPDLEEDAEVKLLFWETPVKIQADDGAPVGTVALKRFGDAVLETDEDGNLSLEVEVGIDDAECGYEYKTHVAKVKGPGGRFTAKVGATTLKAKVTLYLNSYECRVVVSSLEIAQLGEITLEDGGSKVANSVYRKLLVDMLTKKRYSVLQSIVEAAEDSYGYSCDNLLPSFLAAAPRPSA